MAESSISFDPAGGITAEGSLGGEHDASYSSQGGEGKPLEALADHITINCQGWTFESEFGGEPFAEYIFELSLNDAYWTIKKRFSQFVELNDTLSMAFPMIRLPSLPEKKWFGNNSPEVLRDRSFKLQLYLQHLLTNRQLSTTIALSLFLDLKRHKIRDFIGRVLVPLPDKDFDTTEVSVPWKLLINAGFEVIFATENGGKPTTDPLLIRPEGVVFGQLGADPEPKSFYREMEREPLFLNPITWNEIVAEEYDGLLLPGGHSPGMKQYLESKILQSKIVQFWKLNRPVAAICHGSLLLARCIDETTGKSVLFKRRTTTLPKYMENLGYSLTAFKYGRLYRTYEEYCEDEVRSFLEDPERQFDDGPTTLGSKGTLYDDSAAFVVEDGKYLSARWPGDAYLFGRKFIKLVEDDIRERKSQKHQHHQPHQYEHAPEHVPESIPENVQVVEQVKHEAEQKHEHHHDEHHEDDHLHEREHEIEDGVVEMEEKQKE